MDDHRRLLKKAAPSIANKPPQVSQLGLAHANLSTHIWQMQPAHESVNGTCQ